MSSNGKLKQSELGSIGGGHYMRKDAARAFNELNAAVKKKYGRGIGVVSSYRTYSRQVYFWNLYVKGKGNLAARPGTSNHGVGLAIDVDNWSQGVIERMGSRYGFQKKWSDAPSEPWHYKWSSSHYNPPKKESIYKHLTKNEAHHVAMLRSSRKKAKAEGGWDKANPQYIKDAVKSKDFLRKRIKTLQSLNLDKLNRRTRLKVMRDTIGE